MTNYEVRWTDIAQQDCVRLQSSRQFGLRGHSANIVNRLRRKFSSSITLGQSSLMSATCREYFLATGAPIRRQ